MSNEDSASNRFGELLRESRLAKGMTLRKFAEALGVSPTYVSGVENGTLPPPTYERLESISILLEVSLEQLVEAADRWEEMLVQQVDDRPEFVGLFREVANLSTEQVRQVQEAARQIAKQPEQKFDPIPACFSGVGFLPIPRLERIVLEKLGRFERVSGNKAKFPIDIEAIVEVVERIKVEYFDERERFGLDVLGAYDFSIKTMFVRSHYDHPGRKRFTWAHEYGHVVLHAGHYLQQVFDFFEGDNTGSVQLNRGQFDTRNKLEWQANKFASHILMPTHLVRELISPLQLTSSLEEIQRILASNAEVSLQAAGIRLRDFGLS